MGKAFTKIALSMAEDNGRMGHVFGHGLTPKGIYDGVHVVEPIPDFPRAPNNVPALNPRVTLCFQSLGPFISGPWR